MRSRTSWAWLPALLLAACSTAPSGSPASGVVTDSAGVRLVQHAGIQPAVSAPTLRLSIDPATSGDRAEFGAVMDVALRADTVFVLDGMAQSISVFDPGGQFVRAIGAAGDGPGELSRLATSLIVSEREVWVADWGRGTMHRFGPQDEVLPTVPIPAGGTRSWWRLGADDRLYARTLRRLVDDGAWAGDDRLVRADPDGALDTIYSFSYDETDLGGPGRPALPVVVNAPMWAILADGSIATTNLESGHVTLLDSTGIVRHVVRSEAWTRRVASSDDIEALRTLLGDKLVALGGTRSTLDQLDVADPEYLPAITALLSTPEGSVMVQRMGPAAWAHPRVLNTPDPPAGWGGTTWDVIGPNGAWAGVVRLPPRVRLLRIADGRLVGVRHDELGQERVVVFDWPDTAQTP